MALRSLLIATTVIAVTGCWGAPSFSPSSAVATQSAAPSSSPAKSSALAPPRATPSLSAGVVSPSPSVAYAPVKLSDAKRCPVTLPGPGPADVSPSEFFGWGSSYGNGKLWVGGLWPDGIIAATGAFIDGQGAVGMKFGWWRAVPGDLSITGRRLDAVAPPVRPSLSSGYGRIGFEASGVTFPTEGCWEVSGLVGDSKLTFVTFVIKGALP